MSLDVSMQKRAWRITADEEYVWSMRIHRAMSRYMDARKYSDSDSDSSASLHLPEGKSEGETDSSSLYKYPEKLLNQAKLLASFLPDEVLIDVEEYTPREIECCLLYARFSGMHNLIERYQKMKPDFKLKLTTQLNDFVGAMVHEILSTGGDVLKFSPTSMVVMWKSTGVYYITENVHTAVDCALVMEKYHGRFILESGEKLMVDFAITAGSIYFSLIGNAHCSRYLIFGSVYEDVRNTRNSMSVPNIIISPAAMQFLNSLEYTVEQLNYRNYYQVIGLTKMWKQVRKHEISISSQRTAFSEQSYTSLHQAPSSGSLEPSRTYDGFCMRPVMQAAIEKPEICIDNVSKFFPHGILSGIVADEPIEHLVQLREITVMKILAATTVPKTTKMWKVTDNIFNIVHRYADKYKGTLNDVSILNNSTMLTIQFGLKGTAYVMQYRATLRCAYEIMGALKYTDKVSGVNIGISSGKVYYTAVGHILRQDLCCFGRTVTDSMALVDAFNDKIVCDQDTFIHSRMKPSCFGLLEANVTRYAEFPSGSIYELLADDMELSKTLPVYDQPAIGREKEIDVYEKVSQLFFETKEGMNIPNTLYIRGYPKEGKSRVLHEMIRITNPNILVHYIPLNSENEDIPYYLVRQIFSAEFDCDLISSRLEDRKRQLSERLSSMPNPDEICAINSVFKVNFPETAEFWNYSAAEKSAIRLKVLKYLCTVVFVTPWLIAVDDADFLDKESWEVLDVLLDTSSFFLLITSNRNISPDGSNTYKFSQNSRVVEIKLNTLGLNYVGAIACQHFRVFAISPELEYLLQKKSNGNIGYMKSLLTNLRHQGHFAIKEVTYKDIVAEKLTTPSMNLIIQMSKAEKNKLLVFIAKKGKYDKNEFKRILWFLFVESFQNEKFYQYREKIYEITLNRKHIRACFLIKEFDNSSIPEDLTLNVHITQVVEMLSYPEQLILKCCCILGDSFPRMVLEHILTTNYYRLLAPAIKVFFEMGILCCGQGDFTDGIQFIVTRDVRKDPQNSDEVTCKCRGIFILERYEGLPDYAYCGLLRFKLTRFREVIYEQLKDNQRVDFHTKVMIFLHEETKRCRSCGRDAFAWDDDKRLDDNVVKRRERKRRTFLRPEFVSDAMPSTLNDMFLEDTSQQRFSLGRLSSGGSIIGDTSYQEDDFLPSVADTDLIVQKILGPVKITKLSKDISLLRAFSVYDFTYCECEQILSAYYREMMVHCRGSCQLMQLFDNMKKYAYLCISNKNISEAHIVLRQALDCINDIFQMVNPPPMWKKTLFEAKIATISASAFKALGSYPEAYGQLCIALKKFGVTFPRGKISKLLSLIKSKLLKLLTFYLLPEMPTKRLSVCVCEYYVDVAEALDLLAQQLMMVGDSKAAELVASWALYKALQAQTNFTRICDCFSNLILITIGNKDSCMNMALEVHALRYCYRKTTRVESWELAAICRMYLVIVIGKFIRSELDYSIHMGYVIIRMAASLNDTEKLLLISSYLCTVLVSKLYLQEASNLLLELQFCAENMDDLPGQVWFHSQALLFHIETGYCIVPYQQCMSFMEIHGVKVGDENTDEAIGRLTIMMWLWCLRNEQWERAARFDRYIDLSLSYRGPSSIRAVLSLIFVLEGFLLIYVNKLNKNSISDSRKFQKLVERLIRILDHESKFLQIFQCRIYYLKAYYFYIRNEEKKAFKWLQNSLRTSEKNGIHIVEESVKHTMKAWRNELPRKKRNFWREHCEEYNLMFYQEFDMNTEDLGFFTLPTPLYI